MVDLVVGEHLERAVAVGAHDADLDIGRLQILAEHILQRADGRLQGGAGGARGGGGWSGASCGPDGRLQGGAGGARGGGGWSGASCGPDGRLQGRGRSGAAAAPCLGHQPLSLPLPPLTCPPLPLPPFTSTASS